MLGELPSASHRKCKGGAVGSRLGEVRGKDRIVCVHWGALSVGQESL